MCGKSEREKKQEIYDAVASNLRLNYEGISEEEIFHLVGDIMSPEPTGNKELDLLNSLMEGNKRDFGQE
jgi:hypothetical protein